MDLGRLYDNGWTVLYKRTVVGRDESNRKENGRAPVWLYVCLDVGGWYSSPKVRSRVARRINDNDETNLSPTCFPASLVRLVKADALIVPAGRIWHDREGSTVGLKVFS
jgi:hypothetical protein